MWAETVLCRGMGYSHCILFSKARVAIAYFIEHQFGRNHPLFIPSNVCPSLQNAVRDAILVPVSSETGLAKPTGDINVQLYGFRQEYERDLEIDPLMTGWGQRSKADNVIISFGYSKTIDIGGGAALLTNDKSIVAAMRFNSDWPGELTEHLERELRRFSININARRAQAALWDKYLPDDFKKPMIEQIIPWRVIRRVPKELRHAIVQTLRLEGFLVGTNYPPLAGCSDPSSVKWGDEVVNLWTTGEYPEMRISGVCELLKQNLDNLKKAAE